MQPLETLSVYQSISLLVLYLQIVTQKKKKKIDKKIHTTKTKPPTKNHLRNAEHIWPHLLIPLYSFALISC